MSSRIALVEDDEVISQNYADFLRGNRFDVDIYVSREAALLGLKAHLPDVVLLDISLNGERDAGFVICAEVRHRYPQLPVIFLTSHDGETDKISGLRLGADDYVTKDASMDFLVVRIEALFRRRETYMAGRLGDANPGNGAGLQLDMEASLASWRGARLELTLTQFWILAEICRHRGEVRSHDELMHAARIVVERNTIAAHVKAIRDTFKRTDPSFDCIRSERARGYRWIDS